MFEYRDRLTAALRSRGADDESIRAALHGLARYPERDLARALGEPEDYAIELAPHRRRKPQVGLIMAGLVLAAALAIGLPVLAEAGVLGATPVIVLAPVLALGALALGVLAEFARYTAGGRSPA